MGLLQERAAKIARESTTLASADPDIPKGEVGFDPVTIISVIGLIFQVIRCLRDRTPTAADLKSPSPYMRRRVRKVAAEKVGWKRAKHAARAILAEAATLNDTDFAAIRAEAAAVPQT